MILNRQTETQVDVEDARHFARRLRTELRLPESAFNVCFVADREMRRLNTHYRGKRRSTDVLSFPWQPNGTSAHKAMRKEFDSFLGDVVISGPTARRNARAEGHSIRREIRWLMIHGVLHLLGYDHETDGGEMTALELSLRARFERKTRQARVNGRKTGRPSTGKQTIRARRK